MSEAEIVREIIAAYEKHGWTLRRILLTNEMREKLANFLPQSVSAEFAAINALWFSRTTGDHEAWEIRQISQLPYALFDSFTADVSDEERRNRLRQLENRLKKKT